MYILYRLIRERLYNVVVVCMMYIQYINLLDKSFRVKNVFYFWTGKDSLEFLSSFSKEAFRNNIFSISISKPKFPMPRNSCIHYMLKRNGLHPRCSFFTRSLLLYVCIADRCQSFCIFSFGHCVVCSSLIYGF